MSRVVFDEFLRAKLNGLADQVEICDESGQTVGYFLPKALYREMVYAWANAQVTDEELDRISREPGGRPLAEIWKTLGRT